MHTQEFGSDWPAALDDILEFVILTQLSLGRGRAGVVKISLSRERVAPDQLQPHVNRFRRNFTQKVPGMRLELGTGHHASHRVDVYYPT